MVHACLKLVCFDRCRYIDIYIRMNEKVYIKIVSVCLQNEITVLAKKGIFNLRGLSSFNNYWNAAFSVALFSKGNS